MFSEQFQQLKRINKWIACHINGHINHFTIFDRMVLIFIFFVLYMQTLLFAYFSFYSSSPVQYQTDRLICLSISPFYHIFFLCVPGLCGVTYILFLYFSWTSDVFIDPGSRC